MLEQSTLANGLRVVTYRMPSAQSVTCCVYTRAGSRHESAAEAGISHFIEHMFFKGTYRRPTPREIAEAIEGVGGDLNAGTNREYTEYYCKVPHAHWPVALDVLSDALRCSRFDPAEIEKERRVVIEELNMIKDDPSEWVSVIIDELLWPNHPLGRDIAGSHETVAGFSRDAALQFMQAHYSPAETVISAAGNVEHAAVAAEVARLLGDWPAHPIPAWAPLPADQASPRLRLERKQAEQAQLCLAVPGLALTDPDRYALAVLTTLLGGGMSSRLFLELRERQALCYDVSCQAALLSDTGAVYVFAGVGPKQGSAAVRAILDELQRIQEPIEPAELAKTKEFLRGQLLLSLEGTASVASWIGRDSLQLGRVTPPEEVLDGVFGVTSDDVNRLAARLFGPGRLRLAVVGPYRTDRKFAGLIGAD